jgi:hypothetical protein
MNGMIAMLASSATHVGVDQLPNSNSRSTSLAEVLVVWSRWWSEQEERVRLSETGSREQASDEQKAGGHATLLIKR